MSLHFRKRDIQVMFCTFAKVIFRPCSALSQKRCLGHVLHFGKSDIQAMFCTFAKEMFGPCSACAIDQNSITNDYCPGVLLAETGKVSRIEAHPPYSGSIIT